MFHSFSLNHIKRDNRAQIYFFFTKYMIQNKKKKPEKSKPKTTLTPAPPQKKTPSKQTQLFLSAYDIYCMFFFVAEVTRIDPFFGSTNGGTRVTIYGSGNKHFVFS